MKIVLILCALMFAISSFAGTFRDDFEDGDYEGWSVADGMWEVKNGILITKNIGDFAVLDIGDEEWRDYTIEFDGKVKSHQGIYCIAGAVRFQLKDLSKGWIYFSLTNQGFNERIEASVYNVQNQFFGMTRKPGFVLELDRWYKFRASIIGKKFDFYLDGKLVISADWSNMPLSPNGIVELWTRYPGEYWFDNVVISGPGLLNTGPSGFNSPFSVKNKSKITTTWGEIRRTK